MNRLFTGYSVSAMMDRHSCGQANMRSSGDANEPTFKYIAKLTKEEKVNTIHNLQVLQPL